MSTKTSAQTSGSSTTSPAEAEPVSKDELEQLLALDREIDNKDSAALKAQSAALRARWEFGRLMVAARDGKGRLPNGYMPKLMDETGKRSSELGYRAQFAEAFPTEAELSSVLESCESWRAVKRRLAGGDDTGPVPTAIKLTDCTDGDITKLDELVGNGLDDLTPEQLEAVSNTVGLWVDIVPVMADELLMMARHRRQRAAQT